MFGAALAPLGLQVLGHCAVTEDDPFDAGTIILIGPDEPGFWPVFTASKEYTNDKPDPLDRWSQRVLSEVAGQNGAQAVFPFGGPPFHPFHSWAVRTGRFWSSPIGFLVHDTAGLFVSFRGALVVPETLASTPSPNPCLTCADTPCATACPVGAFTDGYDVAACKSHLAAPAGTDCMSDGCRARRACPVGQGNRLPAQAAFHMQAFL